MKAHRTLLIAGAVVGLYLIYRRGNMLGTGNPGVIDSLKIGFSSLW